MRMHWQFEALSRMKWNEVATRFLFGGLVTAAAGLVAQHFGPAVGGLLLAFPAIFPASATLLAKKQEQEKAKHEMEGRARGRKAAALEARGAAMGCIGLASFALVVWFGLQRANSFGVLLLATGTWVGVSLGVWTISRKWRHTRRHSGNAS